MSKDSVYSYVVYLDNKSFKCCAVSGRVVLWSNFSNFQCLALGVTNEDDYIEILGQKKNKEQALKVKCNKQWAQLKSNNAHSGHEPHFRRTRLARMGVGLMSMMFTYHMGHITINIMYNILQQ